MAENQGKTSLSPSQERALAGLISQPTLALAAASAKVGERTLYRWLAEDKVFQSEYRRIRRQILNSAVFQMQKATDSAVQVTIGLMTDPDTPSSTRLAAARAVLELSLEFLKVEELEERIRQLEEKVDGDTIIGRQGFTNGATARHSIHR
jgi:hypothetical protein